MKITDIYQHCSNVLYELFYYFTGHVRHCRRTPVWLPCINDHLAKGIGLPLQYSWTSLVAWLIKWILPAMVRPGINFWFEHPEKYIQTHSMILGLGRTEHSTNISTQSRGNLYLCLLNKIYMFYFIHCKNHKAQWCCLQLKILNLVVNQALDTEFA